MMLVWSHMCEKDDMYDIHIKLKYLKLKPSGKKLAFIMSFLLVCISPPGRYVSMCDYEAAYERGWLEHKMHIEPK